MSELCTLRVCSSCAFATAAMVFYKKTFRKDKLPIVGALTLVGIFLEHLDNYLLYSIVGILVCMSFVVYTISENREWFNTAIKPVFFCFLLFAILDVRNAGRTGLEIPYWTNVRIFVAAIPQFLRKPQWLKTKLQDIRSKLGPIYVLYVSSYVLTRNVSDVWWLQEGLLAIVAMCSSIFAGVFVRPDNSAMLEVIAYLWKLNCNVIRVIFRSEEGMLHNEPYRTTHSVRRYYHGRLMMCSFGCFAFLVAADVLL